MHDRGGFLTASSHRWCQEVGPHERMSGPSNLHCDALLYGIGIYGEAIESESFAEADVFLTIMHEHGPSRPRS